jgi:hypothetical protein
MHRPDSYLKKRDVSETGFCFRLQVEPIQMGPVERLSLFIGPT